MKIVGIKRDVIFSPNSVEKDRMILQQVLDGLGDSIKMIDEKMLSSEENADVYISMARHSTTLELLKEKENEGALVINSAYSVERCERGWLNEAMRIEGLPIPDSEGKEGYWLKRGDMSAQSKADIVYWIVQAHIPGDLVKFYGVSGGFFRYYYPNDDGISKFGDEELNGEAHHYDFDVDALQAIAERVSMLTGVEVYGGDAIVTASGTFYIIDFNDWPSFSRCRNEASEAIIHYIKNKINSQI